MILAESRFPRPGGVGLHLRDWRPDDDAAPRGVLILHGLGEHAGRYAALARWWCDRGWRVRAHDHRGHGRSDGSRGRLHADDDLLTDAQAVLADFSAHLAAPPIVLGHSLGGALAAQLVVARGAPASGLVLSSPALDPGLSAPQRWLTRTLYRLAPDLIVGNGLDPSRLSRDPDVVRRYREDPLVHDRVSARLVNWLLRAGDEALRAAPTLAVDTLLLVAGDDALVAPAGSRRFAAAAPGDRLAFREYPGLYHEIFNELPDARATVLDDLARWLALRSSA